MNYKSANTIKQRCTKHPGASTRFSATIHWNGQSEKRKTKHANYCRRYFDWPTEQRTPYTKGRSSGTHRRLPSQYNTALDPQLANRTEHDVAARRCVIVTSLRAWRHGAVSRRRWPAARRTGRNTGGTVSATLACTAASRRRRWTSPGISWCDKDAADWQHASEKRRH